MRSNSRIVNNFRAVSHIVQNVLLERQAWLRKLLDPRRDIDLECGHPLEITKEDYKGLFLRGDIANRVVSVLPEESWARRPEVLETEEDTETEFEKAWDELERELNIIPVLQRADVLSGIGQYGILLLGLNDGKPLGEPVEGLNEMGMKVGNPAHELLYLRPFDEALLGIEAFQTDTTNPRYGFPTRYRIQFEETVGSAQKGVTGDVHWSRVIHLADNRTSSDIYGLPRMQKVFNRLLDVRKIAGGSGEMFWKGGFPGLSIETQAASDENVEFDPEATKAEMEAYMNGLQRYIATTGLTAKSLTVNVADPLPHLQVQIRLIANALGIPWRVFMGSEAAQLASEQDTLSWNRRLHRRREEYITPYILRPFTRRLTDLGILPEPTEVIISWPDLNSPSDGVKAAVAAQKTEALAKYVQSGADVLIPPFHYLTRFLDLSDDEAHAILEEAEEALLERPEPPPPVPGAQPAQPARVEEDEEEP